jgi:hypothetical protein
MVRSSAALPSTLWCPPGGSGAVSANPGVLTGRLAPHICNFSRYALIELSSRVSSASGRLPRTTNFSYVASHWHQKV